MGMYNDTVINDSMDVQIEHSHLTPSLYITLAMLTVFSFFGVVGNALVLYVYVRKRDRLTSTFFIIMLAAIDFITCCVIIPWTIYFEYVQYSTMSDLFCKLYQFLVSSNIPFSVFIMVAIAVDRYFCICHPFMNAMTMRKAQITTIVMGLYAAALGSLVACMFGVWKVLEPEEIITFEVNGTSGTIVPDFYNLTNNEPVVSFWPVCTKTNLIFSDKVIGNYRNFHVAQYVICLICIMILYALIYHKVLSRRLRRLNQATNLSLHVVSKNANDVYTQDTEISAMHNGDKGNGNTPSPVNKKNDHNTQVHRQPDKALQGENHANCATKTGSTNDENNALTKVSEAKKAFSQKNQNTESEEQCMLSPEGNQGSVEQTDTVDYADDNDDQKTTEEAEKVPLSSSATMQEDDNGGNRKSRQKSTLPISKVKAKALLNDSATGKLDSVRNKSGNNNGVSQRRNSRRDRMRSANIKTAVMLSVVTIVFVITYAPAFLMLCFPGLRAGLGELHRLFHYLYFANNVANPIIYSFMNQNFRADLKQIFKRSNSRY